MGEITTEQVGRVRIVTISNEPKRNAMSVAMERPFRDALAEADGADEIRAIVVTGAGNLAFCSGHDLSEVGTAGVEFMQPDPLGYPATMRKPVIAAVNGHCHAGGLMLALSCDMRIASENAVFGQPAVRFGQMPMGGQIWRLNQAMAQARAMEMLLTAEAISGRQALEWGIVSRLVPAGEALPAAIELAERVARHPSAGVEAVKAGQRLYERSGVDAFEAYEAETADRLMHEAATHGETFNIKKN